MSKTIQIRRDTAADWANVNPTLSDGELGLELDTGKIKVGSGGVTWNNLPYINNQTIYTGPTPPSNPQEGDIWYQY